MTHLDSYCAFLWMLVAGVTLSACSHVSVPTIPREHLDFSPAKSVTREEAILIAEAYQSHSWKPTSENAYSGPDADGIHVQSPDISYQPNAPGSRAGWWIPGKTNIGIPYQWGGFDTPSDFNRKVAAGYYAGDIYTEAKRKGLEGVVSRHACGIDCSGFISRCWRLDRSYSTRELASICDQLPNYSSLRMGDLINKENVHALLFVRFLDAKKSRFLAFETGSPPTWKVVAHPITVDYVRGLGYLPYRYRHMRD